MAIREGKWRCPHCDRVNRGAHMACLGCGATRDADVRFFLEEDAPEVQDEALLEQARAGADWLCEYCDTSNPPREKSCRQCGAGRGSSPSRPVREVRPEVAKPKTPAPSKKRSGCCGGLLALLLLLVTGLCGVLGYYSLRKTEERVTVTGLEWQRSVEVEVYRSVEEEAWEGELPPGARPLSVRSEVHHTESDQVGTEQVKVGTRDMGNGFFEDVYEDRPVYRDRDVYRDKIRYEIERWVVDRTESAKGNDGAAHWPPLSLRADREREGKRREEYVAVLKGQAKVYRMALPLARWQQLRVGTSHTAVVRGGVRVIELR